jgi:hypothetical protein
LKNCDLQPGSSEAERCKSRFQIEFSESFRKTEFMAMGIEFIHRVIKTSLVLAALGFLFVTVCYDFKFGGGILAGAVWGCLNLLFLTHLITEVFTPGKEVRKAKVIVIALVKFPLLYLFGFVLLKIDYFPPVSLVSGFTLIFMVMFLKALGRWILSLDSRERKKMASTDQVRGSEDGRDLSSLRNTKQNPGI